MLSKNTQRFILYTAFTQSVLLLIIHELLDRNLWPATSMPLRVLWYTIVLALPTTVSLLLREVRDRRFWGLLGIYGLVLVPLALHAGAQYVPAHHTEASAIFFPYVLTQLTLWFIASFFIEAAQDGGRFWHTPNDVCAYAWRNFLTLGLLGLFFGVLMLVLLLWALLFKLLNIEFFWFLFFDSHRFIYPFFGVCGGIGVLILRNQANVVSLMEKIAGALLRLLLPLVALISILFLVTLPFTGVQLLWKTGKGTYLMMWLVCLMLLLMNVTRQHERDLYQRFLEWVNRLTFLLLPFYIGLSAWGIGLRVSQHGWSHDRLWTVVILFLQACFVVAYILTMNLPGRRWVERLPTVNKNLGAMVAVTLLLVSTPFLDLRRLTVADQTARLTAGKVEIDKFDYGYLRFSLGEYGYQATLALQQSPAIVDDPRRSEYLKTILASEYRWNIVPTVMGSAADITVLPQGTVLPPELMALATEKGTMPGLCGATFNTKCTIFHTDILGDGRQQYVFIGGSGWYITVVEQISGKWQVVAYVDMRRMDPAQLIAALESGKFALEKPLYPDIVVNGTRYTIEPARLPR